MTGRMSTDEFIMEPEGKEKKKSDNSGKVLVDKCLVLI